MGEEAVNETVSVTFCDVIERIRAGDIRGEEELYRVFSRGFRYLLARSIPAQDVHDKLHDTFIALFQAVRRGSPRNAESLPAFAYRILRRQIANTYRARKSCAGSDTAIGEVQDPNVNGLDLILRNEQRQTLKRALAALASEEREVIMRFYVAEEAPKQIQGDMQLTEARFYVLKARGRKKLLALLRQPVQRSSPLRAVKHERSAV